jgi:hypothetical protein
VKTGNALSVAEKWRRRSYFLDQLLEDSGKPEAFFPTYAECGYIELYEKTKKR